MLRACGSTIQYSRTANCSKNPFNAPVFGGRAFGKDFDDQIGRTHDAVVVADDKIAFVAHKQDVRLNACIVFV